MLNILTHFNKIERVSRLINPATFVAAPGLWAVVAATGILENVTTGTAAVLHKLVIGNASSNVYESHDVSIGRITTVESPGVRCEVDSEGYDGTIVFGERLIVSNADGTEGKLVGVTNETEADGNYEVVAVCEKIDTTAGILTFRTMMSGIVHAITT